MSMFMLLLLTVIVFVGSDTAEEALAVSESAIAIVVPHSFVWRFIIAIAAVVRWIGLARLCKLHSGERRTRRGRLCRPVKAGDGEDNDEDSPTRVREKMTKTMRGGISIIGGVGHIRARDIIYYRSRHRPLSIVC